jgi:hypothetical protein
MKQKLYKGCLIKNKLTSNFGVVIDFGLYPTTDYAFIDDIYAKNTAPIVMAFFGNLSGKSKIIPISKNVIEIIC